MTETSYPEVNPAVTVAARSEDQPRKTLHLTDAIALIVGIVVGAGIFRLPSLVAANTESDVAFMLVWVVGGLVSLVGAFSYAELASTYPHAGGDYHFLSRAYGKKLAFLFAWARMSVIQTGSIALLAYIFGDYAAQIYPLGTYGAAWYAGSIILLLTLINILGIRFGSGTQKLLTIVEIIGVLMVIAAGLFFTPNDTALSTVGQESGTMTTSLGMAMVFVLLTFGGWNEAAYISAEMKSGPRSMAKAMVVSIILITAIYLLINIAYLRILGHQGMATSDAVAADLMRHTWGEGAVSLIGMLVAIAALTSANATILTGARSNYALGRDFRVFSSMGKWNKRTSAPINALIWQGLIALALVSLGLLTRNGFETIVEYTAPVFWFFLLLVGISVFVMRRKDPMRNRPFRVPLYPVLPLLFCITCAGLLYSSLVYTGTGAWVGIGVLAAGIVLLLFAGKEKQSPEVQTK